MSENDFLSLQEDGGKPGPHHGHGLAVLTTALFAVGEMAGSGILALPAAISQTGVIGFALVAATAVVCAYTGTLLGRSWTLVQQRYVEYKDHPRYPYPAIGQITYGRVARLLVSLAINVTMFGSSVVYLLLATENVQSLASRLGADLSYCLWLVIVAAFLCPVTWLGTPKDFWPIAITAAVATMVACCLIVANIVVDAQDVPEAFHGNLDLLGFLTAMGTICFAYGGHAAFPTIQADMKQPEKFGISITITSFTMLAMYTAVTVSAYVVYGSNTQGDILDSISEGALRSTAQVLMTLHLLGAFIILINPVCQEGEALLRIPYKFCLRRALFRTAMTGVVLFVAESVPQFESILSLIGGSSVSALGFIFPPLFYLKLCAMEGDWPKEEVPLHVKVACIEIVLVGVFILVAVTYSSLEAVISSDFSTPCYL